jgi:hypothetical protein
VDALMQTKLSRRHLIQLTLAGPLALQASSRAFAYEGVDAAARPCNGQELGCRLRDTHAEAVGRVRPWGQWCWGPVGAVGPGSLGRHQW